MIPSDYMLRVLIKAWECGVQPDGWDTCACEIRIPALCGIHEGGWIHCGTAWEDLQHDLQVVIRLGPH